MSGTLSLGAIEYSRHAIFLRFAWERLRFSTSYWYQDVDFHELAATLGEDALERLLFHIALFEINKIASLRPAHLDLGAYRPYYTAELDALWRTVFHHVWAQWRYENNDPHYHGPTVLGEATDQARRGAVLDSRGVAPQAEVLALCGGGKDSLVSLELLRRNRIACDTLVYSSSIYGAADPQHALADRLLASLESVLAPGQRAPTRRRQWIYDDFLDSPVLRLHHELGVRTLTAAETPSSVFAALPIALAHGYRYIALGHERSANTGQIHWPETGEDVNHQWGKSFAAETLINRYIQRHLCQVTYFSLLAPIYDVVIFGLLPNSDAHVPFTHSCNVRKPWCLACPKCVYVWLGYAAFLPRERLVQTFGHDDLLSREPLVPLLRELMGLDGKQPFECIGQADEARLYLALAWSKGHRSPMADALLADAFPGTRTERYHQAMRLSERYLGVDTTTCNMPPSIAERVIPSLQAEMPRLAAYISESLAPLQSSRSRGTRVQ